MTTCFAPGCSDPAAGGGRACAAHWQMMPRLRARWSAAVSCDYPRSICATCGGRLGRKATRWSSWSPGTCGWCGRATSVTEPRDYGYPPAPEPAPAPGGGRMAPPVTDPDTPAATTAGASAPQGRPVETQRSRPQAGDDPS